MIIILGDVIWADMYFGLSMDRYVLDFYTYRSGASSCDRTQGLGVSLTT